MVGATQIEEHIEVVGSDGQHVGSVDNLGIKLTKNDPEAYDQHHYINLEKVSGIGGGRIILSMSGAEALAELKVFQN